MSVFDSAISSLAGADDSAPESFINYWERTGQRGRPRTADHISVQTLAGLDAALARQRLFPFRLGRSADRGTAFALARSQALNDFFLEDSEVFPLKAVDLGTDLSPLQVFQFLLFTKQVEVNTVNLAVASGAIHRALRLDADTLRVSPASIASTFSFRVRPTVRDVVHAHDRGQVEIDAALIAKREGRPVVLVVEAKHGDASEKAQSLAKTKITYPLSAVLSGGQVPPGVPVVGVYLRTWVRGPHLVLRVAECHWPGMDALRDVDTARPTRLPAVTSLTVARSVAYRLELPASWPA